MFQGQWQDRGGGNCHLRLPLSLWAQRLLRARWLRWRWLKRAAKGEPAAESGYRRSRDHQPLGARASASGGATGPHPRSLPLASLPQWAMRPPPCLPSPRVVSSCGPGTTCFSQQQRSDRFLPYTLFPVLSSLLKISLQSPPRRLRSGTSWPTGSPELEGAAPPRTSFRSCGIQLTRHLAQEAKEGDSGALDPCTQAAPPPVSRRGELGFGDA